MKSFCNNLILMSLLFVMSGSLFAQQGSKFKLGGYGEAVFSRNFYSDDFARYVNPDAYKNKAEDHGRVDIPHFVLFTNYDFGKGWLLHSEIEFEHGGTGSAVELEAEETGEYEKDIEKGGEVTLEEMWIQKRISSAFNIRVGHMVVPIGGTNTRHVPISFFTNYRPEGEATILPCTWHQTGIGFWGNVGKWKYTAQFLPGLDALLFSNDRWIGRGASSPFEFKIANTYAAMFRIDNHSIDGLQLGVSGYIGNSGSNALKDNYKNIKGTVRIAAFDFLYDKKHLRARGGALIGQLTDSERISLINRRNRKASPSPKKNVASEVVNLWAEAGYDVFSFFDNLKNKGEKLYVFASCNYYDSMHRTENSVPRNNRFERTYYAFGVNYFPMRQLVVKAEYGSRQFNSPYNAENSLLFGVAFTGLFVK